MGICDPPDAPNRTIKIDKRLKHKLELDTILHEIGGHAANHLTFSEEYVNEWSTDVTEVLWKLGYRRIKDKQELKNFDATHK